MKRSTELICGSSIMLFHGAVTAWLFCLASIDNTFERMELSLPLLCGLLLSAYFVLYFILEKSLPIPVIAAVLLIFTAAGIYAFISTTRLQPSSTVNMVICGIFYVTGFPTAAYAAWEGVRPAGITLRFDITAALIILLLVIDNVRDLPYFTPALLACSAALLLSLLGIASWKAGSSGRGASVEGDPAAGRIMTVIAFVIVGLIAAAAAVFISGRVQSFSQLCLETIKLIVSAIKSVLGFILGLIYRFLLWLSGFFTPDKMDGAFENDQPVFTPDTSISGEAELPGWLWLIPVLIAACLIALLVYKLRHVKASKLHRRRRAATASKRGRKPGNPSDSLMYKLKARLLYRLRCIKYRRTAPGLLAYCERKAPADMKRKHGESGEAFLLRLSGELESPELCSALIQLAEYVEKSFYSPQTSLVPQQLFLSIRRERFVKKAH